ncbi:MAG: hypothetical protein M3Y59_02705 [Myxococcota bacterium]|nr:hypothetical protein [Myxococcota bacterium]
MKWWTAVLVVTIAAGSITQAAPPKKRSGKPDAGVSQRRVRALKFGTLEIKVQEGVTVFVDDRDLGKSPLAPIKLLEGSHRVRFVHPALGLDDSQTVEIRAGQISSLEINYET